MGIDISHERKTKKYEEKSSSFFDGIIGKIKTFGMISFLVIGGVILMVMFADYSPDFYKTHSTKKPAAAEKRVMEVDPIVTAINNMAMAAEWKREGFGSVLEIDMTVINRGATRVKDFEVTCAGFAKSGTIIDHKKNTVFDTLGPGETKTIRKLNMGFLHSQVENISCKITDLKI